MNRAEDVQLLALVLVDTLDLDIKESCRVDSNASTGLDVLCESDLVGILDLLPLLTEVLVLNGKLDLV